MKNALKTFSIVLTAVCLGGCIPAFASEPVEWTAKPGDGPKTFVRHRGAALEFKCTFTGFGTAFADGSDVRLWFQTNGMGRSWWSVPATRSNDVLVALWPPSADPGADRVSFFFGAPSNAYASALVRLQNSPGFAPNGLHAPVELLDFSKIEVANAPWPTLDDTSTWEAVNAHLAYGFDLGTGAFFGDRSNGIGLGYAGGLYYLRGETGGWDASYKIVRMSDLAPYALKSDTLPTKVDGVTRVGLSTTGLTVTDNSGMYSAILSPDGIYTTYPEPKRFSFPANSGRLATLDDIPTGGIDVTVLTVTNTEDRVSFPSPDAKSIVGRANLISTDTKMTVTNSLLTIVKNGVVLWQEEDDGYYMFDHLTNLNHSVVTITSDFEHSSWDTVIPNAEDGELRDWIVTIFASEESGSTLSFGQFAEQGYAIWASDGVIDAEDPSISTIEQGTAAMFYFTEIKPGLFVVGKANLSNAITPAPASEVQ